ncbi:MAG: BamA/TamA family outer membrane protein, partial [Bacteroidota bacterium]
LDPLTPEQRARLMHTSKLRPSKVDTHAVRFEALGQRYSETKLIEERAHILSSLRNVGYARVSRDSVRARVIPAGPQTFDVEFRIGTGRRFRIGEVELVVNGPEASETRVDTLRPETSPALVRISNERGLETEAFRPLLRFWPGEWYDGSRLAETKRRLESTGLFSFTDFVPQRAVGDAPPQLPVRIEMRTRPRHRLRFESFVQQRTAALGDEVGGAEVGLGGGIAYNNGNLFGRGERFGLRTAGSFAADLEGGLFNTAQVEVESSIQYPYLIWPFRWLDDRVSAYDTRSRLALNFLSARRAALLLSIRGRASLQAGLEIRHSRTLSSVLNLVEFNLSDPDTLAGFSERFLSGILDPVEREQLLEDYSRPQVNNALRYALRSSTANPFRRDQGYTREASFEIGGNVPYLLDRFVFTGGETEGSLPGLGDSRLVYRQYVRGLFDVRRYRPVTERTVFAWKLIAGMAHPIGEADVVPFEKRFYSGGSTSVRGWDLRELGPGRLEGDQGSVIQGGDIKLEASIESRNTVLQDVFNADWMAVVFVDAGNTWYGPRNPGAAAGRIDLRQLPADLGVSTGLGVRIAWEYLIVRFDLAGRIHEPAAGFELSNLLKPRLHFGIGQAF